jgi:tRNA 5-methylaminomethyl-2-thiouridine biosynthesis bifunctional protein
VWGELAAGVHSFSFAHGRVQLTLAIGDVLPALQSVQCEADAVFLDGFSPSVNPQMWSLSTLRAVTEHVRPGSRLASYTIARSVRDGLSELGYTARKVKGLAPKRDRLEAVFGSD